MSGVRRGSPRGQGTEAPPQAKTAASAVGKSTLVASRYPALDRALDADRAHESAPTLHDAATAAVEHKDGGAPVDSGVAGRVGAHLGVDFSGVRVHSDPLAQQATDAMGARAFAYGNDVFLGPGESGGDLGLMAHELTHVVQQGAAGARAPQRAVTVGDAHSPAEHQADRVAAEITSGTGRPAALLVDNPPVGPGQMLKAQFIDHLRAHVTAAANEELGPFYSTIGCPHIDQYFGRYAGQPASAGEALLRRFAPATRSAQTASEMFPIVVARVREGVRTWRDTGTLPPELAAAQPSAAQAGPAASPDAAQRKVSPDSAGASGTPEHVMAALGEGAPIDSGVASRMGGAFGTSFSDVRIHTDAAGAAMAQQQGALAFTVGNHVAFAPGRYQPGSIEGDALFAHELTHVLQQRGATQGGSASAGHGAESDADRGAAAAVKNLHGGSTEKASASVTSDYQLQRCGGADVEKGLMGADFKGKFLNQKVGEDHTDILAPFSPSIDSKITATRTLGAFDTEAAACAAVKANGKSGAITVEDGKFVAYETDIGFTYRDYFVSSMSEAGGGTQFHPPKLAPGVIVLISNEMMEVRAGQFDPGAKAAQQGSADQQMSSTADPFGGYRQALGDAKGDLNGVSDDRLLAAFDAALKDTALVVLNKSKQQVEAKQGRFADSGAGMSDTELEQMKSTAQLLADDDVKISASKDKLFQLRLLRGLSTSPDDPGFTENPLDPEIEAEQNNLQQLQTVRKIHVSRYPLLSRVDPAKFKDLSKADMAGQLGGELPGILKDIETTKQNVADGSINLWEVDQVVDATIAGFGLDESKRKVIEDKRKAKAQSKTVATIVFTVFAIGFGLAAVFATGGTALFFAAGAFGLSTFDAMRQTEQYAIDKPASNVDLDKDAGFTAPPGWGWLVVAWIGVGLDGLMVASAVGKIAKAEKTIAEAATELAADAKRLGMTQEELIAKLRQAAGDVDGAARITESTKSALAGKLGLPVEIDPQLVGDVRVYYEVDKATGRAIVKSVAAGPRGHARRGARPRERHQHDAPLRGRDRHAARAMGQAACDRRQEPHGRQPIPRRLEGVRLVERAIQATRPRRRPVREVQGRPQGGERIVARERTRDPRRGGAAPPEDRRRDGARGRQQLRGEDRRQHACCGQRGVSARPGRDQRRGHAREGLLLPARHERHGLRDRAEGAGGRPAAPGRKGRGRRAQAGARRREARHADPRRRAARATARNRHRRHASRDAIRQGQGRDAARAHAERCGQRHR